MNRQSVRVAGLPSNLAASSAHSGQSVPVEDPDEYELSEDQKARALEVYAEAQAIQAEVHRLRGQHLAVVAAMEGILNLFLALYFLRHREDPTEHSAVRTQWYSWLLGSITFTGKIEVVERICKGGVGMEQMRDEGMVAVLKEVRAVNTRRNEIAHSSVDIWPVDIEGSFAMAVTTFRTSRSGWVDPQPVDIDALRRDVEYAEKVGERLQLTHFRGMGAE